MADDEMNKNEIENVEKTSPDIVNEHIEQLKYIFPEAFSEGKIDFENLKAALGDLVDTKSEKYSFTWAGKRNAIQLLQTPSSATLVPAEEESVNFDVTQNLFLEGDNLEVLKLLHKSYSGQVKMIYIDPPYNTGNDFIYPDNFTDPLETYLEITGQKDVNGNLLTSNPETSGRFHSSWLSMMYPRLYLARQLLQDDGFIFVSIDDNEVSRLRMLMDEIFGEENFVAPFYIKVRYEDKTLVEDMVIQKLVETVLVYRKSAKAKLIQEEEKYSYDKFVYKIVEKGIPKKLTLGNKEVEIFDLDAYDIVEVPASPDGLKEIWATGKILDGNSSGRFFRDFITDRYKTDGYGVIYKVYGIGDDKFNFRYFTGPKREGATKGKYFQGVPNNVLDNSGEVFKQKSIDNFYDMADAFGNIRHEGGVEFRSGKKPVKLLKKIINYVVNSSEDAIILDFFAGSCTTAHATLELNHEDGGNRHFVCIQLPELIDNSEYTTIAEIGKERIRHVITKMKQEEGKLSLWNQEKPEDLGFKVFKLARSNFKQWNSSVTENVEAYEKQLALFTDPLRDNWILENMLWEVAIKEGYGFNTSIERIDEIQGNTVWKTTDRDKDQSMLICLDDDLKSSTLAALPLTRDHIFVCLNKALNDTIAANLALQCRLKKI